MKVLFVDEETLDPICEREYGGAPYHEGDFVHVYDAWYKVELVAFRLSLIDGGTEYVGGEQWKEVLEVRLSRQRAP